MTFIKLITALIFAIFFVVGIATTAFAQNASMGVRPGTGSYEEVFSVDLFIDGRGSKFNAAEANIQLDNLMVEDITLGDCEFSFIKPPSTTDLSFQGVLLSTYSQGCVVYSMTLIPLSKGDGAINFSNVSIKRFGDAEEILSETIDGKYTLNADASSLNKNISEEMISTGANSYILDLKIISDDSTPVQNIEVMLKSPANDIIDLDVTDNDGIVSFSELESGVYLIVVSKNGEALAENVVNITGNNKRLALNIKVKPVSDYPLSEEFTHGNLSVTYVILALFILFLLLLFIFSKKFKKS